MQLRERREHDLDDLVALAARVQDADGYPVYLPDGDLERFLLRPATIAAFVGVSGGEIIGHIAVNETTSVAAMRVLGAATAGRRLGVVARLLVEPTARRAGTGRALLRHAAGWAIAQGRVPVLDVVTTSRPAVELYRSDGWIEIGTVDLVLPGLDGVREHLFVHPITIANTPQGVPTAPAG